MRNLLIVLIFNFLCINLYCQSNIRVINQDILLQNMVELKSYDKLFANWKSKVYSKYQNRIDEIMNRGMKYTCKPTRNKSTEERKRELENELEKDQESIKNIEIEINDQLSFFRNEFTKYIQGKLSNIIYEYKRDNEIDYIIDVETLKYYDESLEITNSIKQIITFREDKMVINEIEHYFSNWFKSKK